MNRSCYLCAFAVLSLLPQAVTLRTAAPKGFGNPSPERGSGIHHPLLRNCAGCHGAQGRGGPAIALGDPVYLADRRTSTQCTTSSRMAYGELRCLLSRKAQEEC